MLLRNEVILSANWKQALEHNRADCALDRPVSDRHQPSDRRPGRSGTVLSAFVKNVGALAMFMPIAAVAKRASRCQC